MGRVKMRAALVVQHIALVHKRKSKNDVTSTLFSRKRVVALIEMLMWSYHLDEKNALEVTMNRRLLFSGAGAAALVGLWGLSRKGSAQAFEVTFTDAEWREMLSPLEYNVMRREATEPPGSSPLDKIYDKGTFHCRGCDLPLYASEHKFDSRTGWPSFWQGLPNAVETKTDYKLVLPRTECHCRRCGSHLGHVFNDGPKPTGKRHCINGVSLTFKSA